MDGKNIKQWLTGFLINENEGENCFDLDKAKKYKAQAEEIYNFFEKYHK